MGNILALAPAAYFIYFLTLLPRAIATDIFFRFDWVPSVNADPLFIVDGLSIFFALLICFIGILIFVYADSYLQGHSHKGQFFIYLYLFMMSMLLLVLSDNLIVMFVCWELTSISSFFLIGFYHEQANARKFALQAMLITGVGGLALLAAFILMGVLGGGFNISEINWQNVQASPALEAILILVFLGAFTKSAQFPFHFWLPNAMVAPTPVSAYLHSATMVKAGIFILFRFNPYLGGSAWWQYALVIFGALTMVTGAWQSTIKNDIKKVLAYITVSALGMITLMIGLGTETALKAALVFLLAHALYKAALFLIAGILDHEEGTKDMTHLFGLFRKSELTPGKRAGFVTYRIARSAGIPPQI
jgi:multicomponent Na+:H+ antiporter subunit A